MRRKCCTCGKKKSFEEFSKNKSKKEGMNSQCKDCQRRYNDKYYETNKAYLINYQKEYGSENQEKVREQKKTYRENNKKYFKVYFKSYYLNNRDQLLDKQKTYAKTENGKLSKAKDRHRRRSMQSKLINDLTVQEKNIILFLQNYKCINCNEYFDKFKPTIDHIMPLINGGGLSKNNVQMLCLSCNSMKGAKEIDYRSDIHKEIIARIIH